MEQTIAPVDLVRDAVLAVISERSTYDLAADDPFGAGRLALKIANAADVTLDGPLGIAEVQLCVKFARLLIAGRKGERHWDSVLDIGGYHELACREVEARRVNVQGGLGLAQDSAGTLLKAAGFNFEHRKIPTFTYEAVGVTEPRTGALSEPAGNANTYPFEPVDRAAWDAVVSDALMQKNERCNDARWRIVQAAEIIGGQLEAEVTGPRGVDLALPNICSNARCELNPGITDDEINAALALLIEHWNKGNWIARALNQAHAESPQAVS